MIQSQEPRDELSLVVNKPQQNKTTTTKKFVPTKLGSTIRTAVEVRSGTSERARVRMRTRHRLAGVLSLTTLPLNKRSAPACPANSLAE